MKFIIFSDSHGRIDAAAKALEYFENSADGFIHLGDYTEDAKRLHRLFPQMICYSVKGNCDFSSEKERIIAKIMGRKIYLCHGHREGVNHGMERLYYKALENDCEAAFFGHSHCKFFDDEGEVILFNPGSISLPRDGGVKSFGVMDIDGDSINLSIYGIYGKEYRIIDMR